MGKSIAKRTGGSPGSPTSAEVAQELAADPRYRETVFACLRSGQYRDFERYWAFEPERWYARHLDEVARREQLLDTLALYEPFEDRRVAVIGCGWGAEWIALQRRGARPIGLDLDGDMLTFCRERAARYALDFRGVCGDGLQMPLAAGTFDWVFLRQILEHVPAAAQPALLGCAGALLRPGGCLLVDTPNRWDLLDRHDTGLPLVHWLPRPQRRWIARALKRDVPTREPGAEGRYVAVHDFASFGAVRRWLARAGPFELLSRYKEYPDLASYREARRRAGRRRRGERLRLFGMGCLDRVVGLNRISPVRAVFRRGTR